MKTVQLSGSLWANVGKKDASSLRTAGLVPCVLYGQGQQTHFSVKQVAIEKIVYSPDVYQVELNIDEITACIKQKTNMSGNTTTNPGGLVNSYPKSGKYGGQQPVKQFKYGGFIYNVYPDY